jgi:hypothetical protein
MKTVPCLALLLLLQAGAVRAAGAERAVWTWEKESYAMVESTAAADDAVTFLRAKHIKTVYLYADAYKDRNLLVSRPELYRGFIRRLHGDGMRVYALLGSAYLHTEEYVLPERRKEALAMFQRVLTYNKAAKAAEKFDGVNMDIEPHILDQWSAQKDRLLLQFLDLGAAMMALKRASGQTLAVGPAIPFWLDGITLTWRGRTKPVSEHVIGIYDYVALMDYRDHAEGRDGMISHAAGELKYAGLRGRKVVIGVEVTPNEIRKVSFNHLAEADLERELALAERAFSPQPAFGGFVLHHYRGYRVWLDRARENTPPAAP